jgi:phenylpropionate dioxygenase-like ring-hydroxylating dioxygenase large terminal subunit
MELAEVIASVDDGRIPASIYSDPAIFALERERLFPRTYQFLAHESEVPKPGDFVVRRIVDDSFIVSRGEDAAIHVVLNMCRHKGMQICRAETGNASHFRCPYHAWTYRNDGRLVGVPFHQEAYDGDAGFDKAAHPLLSPPHVASYRGLVFANLDPAALPLEDALGDFRFFLDLYVNQSDGGVELRGPQRWRVACNWKIGAENFAGDSYHTPHTHASVVDIGLFREPTANKRKEGALYFAGGGGGTTYKIPPGDFDHAIAHVGYPSEMAARMRATWTPEQQALVGEAGFMVSAATVFPNLSFVHNWPRIRPGDDVVPFISIRLWQPVSATETECLSWFAVDRNAPPAFKCDSYKAYLMCFGTSGMFEQDDVENWTSITSVSRGALGSTVQLDSTMGMAREQDGTAPRPATWPAPGAAYVGYGEYNQRALLRMWARALENDDVEPSGRPAPLRIAAGSE